MRNTLWETLTSLKDGEWHAVTQYHYTAWPDKGVPKFSSALINFRNKVVRRSANCQAPLVVHCSYLWHPYY